MKPDRIVAEVQPIPTCITECCREWVSPYGVRGGRCGYCNEKPKFVRVLPESEWITPKAPIRMQSTAAEADQ